MWTIAEIKERGKRAFKGNYWLCVLVAFLMAIFTTGASAATSRKTQEIDVEGTFGSMSPEDQLAVALVVLGVIGVVLVIGLLIRVFLANPINVGGNAFFMSNVDETPAPFGMIKLGFQHYWHNFATLFLRDLYLCLWSLLFIVPGIIKGYSYRMVPYILADEPELSANEVITKSRQMMDGNKWRAFLLDLSFIGWILLGILTLGLGLIFWTAPYMYNANAALYLKLRDEA